MAIPLVMVYPSVVMELWLNLIERQSKLNTFCYKRPKLEQYRVAQVMKNLSNYVKRSPITVEKHLTGDLDTPARVVTLPFDPGIPRALNTSPAASAPRSPVVTLSLGIIIKIQPLTADAWGQCILHGYSTSSLPVNVIQPLHIPSYNCYDPTATMPVYAPLPCGDVQHSANASDLCNKTLSMRA
ncbi:hypothetical protein Fcan01_20903 [Folsomia candida]|uniref:Uncharacterized protein n=1 Tax=Folsomia candida TaxID=158441 RepID=A0A226DHM1_FOLCA|nr:hypothetical protein Fcan01_20903 [Folsomia candida]